MGNQPAAVAAAGREVLATVLPAPTSHFDGTLTVIAQLAVADETTDPAMAYQTAEWQLLSMTNDGLVTYQRTGGPAGDRLVADPAAALPVPSDCPYTLNPGPGGVWTAPDLARAEQLVRASGTRGATVTVTAGPFGTPIPVLSTGRYLVSVLDKLGYRASLRVLGYTAYIKETGDSRRRTQVSWFGWYPDYPAPSDMILPVLSCRSFVPASPFSNLNTAEFCDPRIDAEARQAQGLQQRSPSAAGALWARIDREIVGQAPWVPLYSPQYLVVTSSRVGNFQFDPHLALLIDQLWVH